MARRSQHPWRQDRADRRTVAATLMRTSVRLRMERASWSFREDLAGLACGVWIRTSSAFGKILGVNDRVRAVPVEK